MTLGEFLKKERMLKNLTSDEMAKKMGLCRASYYFLENDKRIPGLKSRKKLCNFLQKKPAFFVELIEETKKKIKGE